MITVWKSLIPDEGFSDISMPKDAEILSTDVIEGECYIWYKVNTENPKENRRFFLAETGYPFPDLNMKFIGTCIFFKGTYVQHLFEILLGKEL